MDHDKVTRDELIGRCEIDVGGIGPEFDDPPSWLPLYLDNDSDATYGEVLCSFQVIPKSRANQFRRRDIEPATEPCVVEIDVVGLRGLRPRNVFGVKAPYLEFDAGDRDTVKRTEVRREWAA